MPNPKRLVTTKIRPNTPKGASRIARPIMRMITSPTASSSRTTGFDFSSGINVSAAPKISENTMIPSMSIDAAACTGLRGTKFTSMSMPNFVVPPACKPCASPR